MHLIKQLGLSDSESDDDDDRLLPAVNVRKKSKMNGMAILGFGVYSSLQLEVLVMRLAWAWAAWARLGLEVVRAMG